jgi:anti-sigma regulatory factor (Ser/Thr protein kinase)
VVTNLVDNAVKFGKSKPIDVTVSRSDGVARLVVRDYGMGIRLPIGGAGPESERGRMPVTFAK